MLAALKAADVCTDEILPNPPVQRYTRSPVIAVSEKLLCYVVFARIHMQNIIISYAFKSIANIICAVYIVQTS